MDTKDLTQVMERIIKATFDRLDYAYTYHKEAQANETKNKYEKQQTRLVFPMYGQHRENETRISEQELRFAFVESFIQYCDDNDLDLFYSVETPTRNGQYSNFGTDNPRDDDPNGRSAEFDLVIYDINNDNLRRRCLIEFKANNADKNDHKKDFLKLNNEKEGDESVLRYFIEVIKSYTDGEGKKSTIESLKSKLNTKKAKFYCYALEGKSSRSKTETEYDKDISYKFITK